MFGKKKQRKTIGLLDVMHRYGIDSESEAKNFVEDVRIGFPYHIVHYTSYPGLGLFHERNKWYLDEVERWEARQAFRAALPALRKKAKGKK